MKLQTWAGWRQAQKCPSTARESASVPTLFAAGSVQPALVQLLALVLGTVILFRFLRARKVSRAQTLPRRLAAAPEAGRRSASKGSLLSSPSDFGSEEWWLTPHASDKEMQTIVAAADNVELDDCTLFGYLRKLRSLGPETTPCRLAAEMQAAREWKQVNLIGPQTREPMGDDSTYWPAAVDLRHGDWALQYLHMGLHCGYARGGHPVKIERPGRHDIARLSRQEGAEDKLRDFYFSLLEMQERMLNEESAAAGGALGVYEIFDMQGLSLFQVARPIIFSFAISTAQAASRMYRGCTQRVAVINCPRIANKMLAPILDVLPSRLRSRIQIFGDDFASTLRDELDDEAFAALTCDRHTLAHKRRRRTSAVEATAEDNNDAINNANSDADANQIAEVGNEKVDETDSEIIKQAQAFTVSNKQPPVVKKLKSSPFQLPRLCVSRRRMSM